MGVRFADFNSSFLKYSMKTETKLFHFQMLFKNGGGGGGGLGGGLCEPPETPLDPPL